jgi:stage II sporulation protein D
MQRILSYISSIPLLLLIPYLSVIFLQNVDYALTIRSYDVDNLIPVLLGVQIADTCENETLKCQAVIARSNFYRHIYEGEAIASCLMEALSGISLYRQILFLSDPAYQTAAWETEDQVLMYEGEWKLVPYHEISSGRTRSGEEVFHDAAYAYLQAVESEADKSSEDYLSSAIFSSEKLPESLTVDQRDSSGYVLSLLVDDSFIEGEAFREGMQLASSNYTIQKLGESYRFLCKGKGHGLGFSQYGGNVLAQEGSMYDEILAVYFPAMELTSVNY